MKRARRMLYNFCAIQPAIQHVLGAATAGTQSAWPCAGKRPRRAQSGHRPAPWPARAVPGRERAAGASVQWPSVSGRGILQNARAPPAYPRGGLGAQPGDILERMPKGHALVVHGRGHQRCRVGRAGAQGRVRRQFRQVRVDIRIVQRVAPLVPLVLQTTASDREMRAAEQVWPVTVPR